MSDLFDQANQTGRLVRDRQALLDRGWTRSPRPSRSGKPVYIWTDPEGREHSETDALVRLRELEGLP